MKTSQQTINENQLSSFYTMAPLFLHVLNHYLHLKIQCRCKTVLLFPTLQVVLNCTFSSPWRPTKQGRKYSFLLSLLSHHIPKYFSTQLNHQKSCTKCVLVRSFLSKLWHFNDQRSHHIETSHLICS